MLDLSYKAKIRLYFPGQISLKSPVPFLNNLNFDCTSYESTSSRLWPAAFDIIIEGCTSDSSY